MNDTDKKRLEEIEEIYSGQDEVWCKMTIRQLISNLKDAMERESRLRELHRTVPRCFRYECERCQKQCNDCGLPPPCKTIAILDGGEG